MHSLMLILTSLYEDTEPKKHPRLTVLFNNVTKNMERVDYLHQSSTPLSDKITYKYELKIDAYRSALAAYSKRFYRKTISDDTRVGNLSWRDLKQRIFADLSDYTEQEWYKNLSLDEDGRALLETLIEAQRQAGAGKPLNSRPDPRWERFIDQRVKELLPNENFYFYKISEDKRKKNIEEE